MSSEKYRFQFRKDGVAVEEQVMYYVGSDGRIVIEDGCLYFAHETITAHLFIATLDGKDVYAGDKVIDSITGGVGELSLDGRLIITGPETHLFTCNGDWRLYQEPSDKDTVKGLFGSMSVLADTVVGQLSPETISMIARDIATKGGE